MLINERKLTILVCRGNQVWSNISGWLGQFKTFKMVLLKIKLGCLNGNYYGLINYSRILYLSISRDRNVYCSRWKELFGSGHSGAKEYALNWFNTWQNQRRDLFEDDITLRYGKLWVSVRQYRFHSIYRETWSTHIGSTLYTGVHGVHI